MFRLPFFFAVALVLSATSVVVRAGWPARVFAPYVYLGAGGGFRITRCARDCGQNYYTLAFITANLRGEPAWDGRMLANGDYYADQISALRRRGGDVIVSFGGEAGVELAVVENDPAALQAKYEAVIGRYQLTWLDFDIEGGALADARANQRRNAVLARLQAAHPGLRISYTLPVDPDGLSPDARRLLADARARGLRVDSVNLMTMDFGARFSAGKRLSGVAIASARRAREQCRRIDPAIRLGLTAMIGQNDVPTEVFTEADARALVLWAAAQPWICSLSFWSANRDQGLPAGKMDDTHSGLAQASWAFTRIFQGFAPERHSAPVGVYGEDSP